MTKITKTLTAIGAAGVLAVATLAAPQPAQAHYHGGGVAAGIIGGLAAGAILGAAVNGPYYGGYYGPGYYATWPRRYHRRFRSATGPASVFRSGWACMNASVCGVLCD